MDELVMLEGPVPAWYRIDATAHGLECPRCAANGNRAAIYARVGGSAHGSAEEREVDGLVHFASVVRVS